MQTFYLGTAAVAWLKDSDLPLFISQRRLGVRRALSPARTHWALDSGGFSELSLYGEWRTTPAQYAQAVRRYAETIGQLDFAAIQDWMCEPFILAQTHLTVREHQRRTVRSYLTLRDLEPELPWLPVVQGWSSSDYEDCLRLYQQAGVDLAALPRVGVGSLCRRQATLLAADIVWDLAEHGLKLHGFGIKTLGLRQFHPQLASADSLAWSYAARHQAPLPGCSHAHCSHCRRYAEDWYRKVLAKLS